MKKKRKKEQLLKLDHLYAVAGRLQRNVRPMSCFSIFPFVCVEVLRPSQPNGAMSSAISLLNHIFTGQA